MNNHHFWVLAELVEVSQCFMKGLNVHNFVNTLNKLCCPRVGFFTHYFQQLNSGLFQFKNLKHKHNGFINNFNIFTYLPFLNHSA